MLASISRHLTDAGLIPSLRGEGLASFLYITGNQRAVEVSMMDQEKIYVEFWDHADPESDAPSVKEEIHESDDAACRSIIDWLS